MLNVLKKHKILDIIICFQMNMKLRSRVYTAINICNKLVRCAIGTLHTYMHIYCRCAIRMLACDKSERIIITAINYNMTMQECPFGCSSLLSGWIEQHVLQCHSSATNHSAVNPLLLAAKRSCCRIVVLLSLFLYILEPERIYKFYLNGFFYGFLEQLPLISLCFNQTLWPILVVVVEGGWFDCWNNKLLIN